MDYLVEDGLFKAVRNSLTDLKKHISGEKEKSEPVPFLKTFSIATEPDSNENVEFNPDMKRIDDLI